MVRVGVVLGHLVNFVIFFIVGRGCHGTVIRADQGRGGFSVVAWGTFVKCYISRKSVLSLNIAGNKSDLLVDIELVSSGW